MAEVRGKVRDHFYGTTAWRKFRAWYIKQHPLCEVCKRNGKLVSAYLVDHIVEIKDGGDKLSADNAQSLCCRCHAQKTAIARKKRLSGVVQPAPDAPPSSPWV